MAPSFLFSSPILDSGSSDYHWICFENSIVLLELSFESDYSSFVVLAYASWFTDDCWYSFVAFISWSSSVGSRTLFDLSEVVIMIEQAARKTDHKLLVEVKPLTRLAA